MGVGERATPQSVARLLPSALRAQAAGGVDTTRAVGVMLPAEDSLDADARQLVEVSCALAAQRGAGRLTAAARLTAERRCRDAGVGVR
ncbi:hypothetical protein [Streptomyces sp. Je 1-332]|uniref:hypothetical protein n=1 Tax=Streptomyces sp. Je 1-332 TaxID=3231270 RepID=UPI00345A7CC5